MVVDTAGLLMEAAFLVSNEDEGSLPLDGYLDGEVTTKEDNADARADRGRASARGRTADAVLSARSASILAPGEVFLTSL